MTASKLGQLFSLLSRYEDIDAAIGPQEGAQATCASVYDFVRQAFLKDPTSDYIAVVGDAGKDLLAGAVRHVEVVCTFRDYALTPAACAKKLGALEEYLQAHSVRELHRNARSVEFRFRKGVHVEVFPAPAEVDWYNIRPPQIPFAAPAARLYQTLWLQRQEPQCKALVRFVRHWADAVWGPQQRLKPSSELLEHLTVYAWSTLTPNKRKRPRAAFEAVLAVGGDLQLSIVLQDYFAEPLPPVVGYQRVIMNVANPRDNLAGHANNWTITWPKVAEYTRAVLADPAKAATKLTAAWLPSPRTEHIIFVSPKTQQEKALALINAAFDDGATVVEVDGVGPVPSEKVTALVEKLDRANYYLTKVQTHTADGSAPVVALLVRRKVKPVPKADKPAAEGAEGAEGAAATEGGAEGAEGAAAEPKKKEKKPRRKPAKDATPAEPVAEGEAAAAEPKKEGEGEGAAAPAAAAEGESNGVEKRPRRNNRAKAEGQAQGEAPEAGAEERAARRRDRRRDRRQKPGVWVKAESKTE